jgi:hypothetical protein
MFLQWIREKPILADADGALGWIREHSILAGVRIRIFEQTKST